MKVFLLFRFLAHCIWIFISVCWWWPARDWQLTWKSVFQNRRKENGKTEEDKLLSSSKVKLNSRRINILLLAQEILYNDKNVRANTVLIKILSLEMKIMVTVRGKHKVWKSHCGEKRVILQPTPEFKFSQFSSGRMPACNPASLLIFTLKSVACCHVKIGQKFLATVSYAYCIF